ncbi:MAG: AAA family ATPase [bacterium]
MKGVILKKLIIKNLGPIKTDEVSLDPFTYFIGRNNSGKSHYLKAISLLLTSKAPDKEMISKLQNDKSQPIEITGHFEGVQEFTSLVTESKHKEAIDSKIKDGILIVTRVLNSGEKDKPILGIPDDDGTVTNITGIQGNLLKVLPDAIEIVATADTVDELKNKDNTALDKLKKEVLRSFLESLGEETKKAFTNIDKFLHSQEAGRRSSDLINFESFLKEELSGEFSEITPSIEFELPDEEVISKGMRVMLDDGHRSEVGQKGHGLQRATLLAMLRVLAKHGSRYQDRPAPIFLIGEIETFLHPYAQKMLGEALDALVDRYQVVTSTHSPFIVSPNRISGYRRVIKKSSVGTKNISLGEPKSIDLPLIVRHLEQRGNLEGLFADRIILIEGKHDEGFYDRLMKIYGIALPKDKFTLFIKAGGKTAIRMAREFYRQMNFDDVSVICDIDYIFSQDAKYLFKELGIDVNYIDELKKHVGYTDVKDPPLKIIVDELKAKGEPKLFKIIFPLLAKQKVFVLRKGAPEEYYKNNLGEKDGWEKLEKEEDLLDTEYLKGLMNAVIS